MRTLALAILGLAAYWGTGEIEWIILSGAAILLLEMTDE